MKNWLKDYFIPHEENDHKPHILRTDTVIFLAMVTLGAELYFFVQAFLIVPNSGFFGLISSNVLVDETNSNRVAVQELALKPNPILIAAAQLKANDMAAKGYFAHTSPDGKTPWYWFSQVGYDFTYAGENLAINFTDSKDVTNAWMNSPGHRANILNNNFHEIGIATAQGIYEGHAAVFVVELFGTPAPSPAFALVPIAKAAGIATIKKTPVPTPTSAPAANVAASSSGGEKNAAIAVKSAEVGPDNAAPTVLQGSGTDAARPVSRQANLIEVVIASPRMVADSLLAVIGIIMLAGLLINILVKIEIQHPQLILNGALMLLLVVATFVLNHYVSFSAIKIL